jgi:cell wall assembly regulator SMI1
MASPAHYPDQNRSALAESMVQARTVWAGDEDAAARFGSPAAIRAALLPEQAAEFDAAYDAALTAARQTLSLDQLHHVLRVWRRVAWQAETDADAVKEMAAAVAEVRRTGAAREGSVSWNDLKAELGI